MDLKKKKSPVKITINIILILILLILGLFSVPTLFGVQYRCVLSGSMEPEIPAGSLVISVPKKFSDISTGDDIVYKTGSYVATHRVIEKDAERYLLKTKGIANSEPDPYVRYSNVIGVVLFSIPRAGRLLLPVGTVKGKILFTGAVLSMTLALFFIDYLCDRQSDRESVK